jgi:hypothetical protein
MKNLRAENLATRSPWSVAIGSLLSVVLVTALTGQGHRTISFDPAKTIASHLLPSDREVAIVKLGPPPGRGTLPPSLDERIDSLKRSGAVLLISRAVTEGIVTADGTWIRSRTVATVDHVARISDAVRLNAGEPIEFWHWNGSAMFDGVNVRAGEWPVFEPDQRYIVSLEYEGNAFTVASAFAVDDHDRLSPVFLTNRAWFSDARPLAGISARELLRRIADTR